MVRFALVAALSFAVSGHAGPLFRRALDPATHNTRFCDNLKALSLNPGGNAAADGKISCSTLIQGKLPAVTQMVSSIITAPQNQEVLELNKPFTIDFNVRNLATGVSAPYLESPQTLNAQGLVEGNMAVTIQDMGDNTAPVDSSKTEFFKEVLTPGTSFSVPVDKSLPAGNFRVCVHARSKSLQPVMMPVAQRGAQDDCVRFTIKRGAAAEGATANGGAAAAGAAGAAAAGGAAPGGGAAAGGAAAGGAAAGGAAAGGAAAADPAAAAAKGGPNSAFFGNKNPFTASFGSGINSKFSGF